MRRQRRSRGTAIGVAIALVLLVGAMACRSDEVATGSGATPGSTTRSTTRPTTGSTAGPRPLATDRRGNPILSRADLLDAKAYWVANRPEHYAWTYTESCFCRSKTLRVEVDGDEIVSTTVVESDEPGVAVSDRERLTVDGLFDTVAGELTDDGRWTSEQRVAVSLTATFDPVDGHPVTIGVGIPVPDAGHGYTISGFEALP